MVTTDDRGLILITATYIDFMEVLNNAKANTLLPHQSIDHAIDLQPDYNLQYWSIYTLSELSKLSRMVLTRLRGLRSRAQELDHRCGFVLKDPMP